MTPDLRLALSLADAADVVTMKHFLSDSLEVRTKPDRSPVSEADEAVERMIRERLAAERPEDGIVGEEFGSSPGARRWIVDPIDGTKNYVRGIPVFATLIALEEQGRITVGVVSAPALSRRWWASRGEGAFGNGRRLRVSTIAKVEEAQLSGGLLDAPHFAARFGRARDFGDFWAHMLVAEGAVEVAIDPIVSYWDMAPIQVIVEEAGGRFSDFRGEARADGGSGISSNGLLHEPALAAYR